MNYDEAKNCRLIFVLIIYKIFFSCKAKTPNTISIPITKTISLTPAPKAGVIVVACTVRASAAGINLVIVPQTKPTQ